MKEVYFVTSNEFKFKLAKEKMKLDESKVKMFQKIFDCPEIQEDSIEEVAKSFL